ncbi:hypothetical protein L1887_58694 [Cichorium endivia]|nr:hypothetical protein L1887_58694 [Cichorium endivia]
MMDRVACGVNLSEGRAQAADAGANTRRMGRKRRGEQHGRRRRRASCGKSQMRLGWKQVRRENNLRTEGCSGVGRMQLEGACTRLGLVVRGPGRQRKDRAAGGGGGVFTGWVLRSELRKAEAKAEARMERFRAFLLSLGDGQPGASESAECRTASPIASVCALKRILWNASKNAPRPQPAFGARVGPPRRRVEFRWKIVRAHPRVTPPPRTASRAPLSLASPSGVNTIADPQPTITRTHIHNTHTHTHTHNSASASAKRAERKKCPFTQCEMPATKAKGWSWASLVVDQPGHARLSREKVPARHHGDHDRSQEPDKGWVCCLEAGCAAARRADPSAGERRVGLRIVERELHLDVGPHETGRGTHVHSALVVHQQPVGSGDELRQVRIRHLDARRVVVRRPHHARRCAGRSVAMLYVLRLSEQYACTVSVRGYCSTEVKFQPKVTSTPRAIL